MKATVIGIGLVILLVGLILPGCSVGRINELEAEIAEKDAQIAELKKERDELQEEIDKIKEELLSTEPSAKMEITFEPNPVLHGSEKWCWEMTITEVNGVGVKLTDIIMEIYDGDKLLKSWSDKSWLEAINYYLPAYGSEPSRRHIPYPYSVTHAIFVVTGIDDNGQDVAARGRVDLSQEELLSAKIEISFDPPYPRCKKSKVLWKVIITEVNGVGVEIQQLISRSYNHMGGLEKESVYTPQSADWLPPYLAPYGEIIFTAGYSPCPKGECANAYVVIGVDDNGNSIEEENEVKSR